MSGWMNPRHSFFFLEGAPPILHADMDNETSPSQSREATIGVAAAASLAAPFRALARFLLPVRCRSVRVTVTVLSTVLAFRGALSTCFADGDCEVVQPVYCEVVHALQLNVVPLFVTKPSVSNLLDSVF